MPNTMISKSTTRRSILKISAATAMAGVGIIPSMPLQAAMNKKKAASLDTPLHGLSVFGDLKYAPDFTQFDYVSVEAPKGGKLIFQPPDYSFNQNPRTFDTLNGFVLKGSAPPRIEMIYDSLMARAFDEPDAVYGLLAETVTITDDGNRYTFKLRPNARFHDGTPLTAEDIAFSLKLLREKGHPSISQSIIALKDVTAPDPQTLVITFDGTQSRELPQFIAQLPVFSKAFLATHTFDASNLERPLGSGPYRIGDFEAGHFIEYERVSNYWGKDLPVNRGHYNFDVIRIDFFHDLQIAFEAFKKGNINLRQEFLSKTWATQYTFPAIQQGKVKKETFPDHTASGGQGFFINTRRPYLQDRRVREALDYAFDFEWVNARLFYGLYKRTTSFFENSPMKAKGLPTEAERALLKPFRSKIPDEVFGNPYTPPISDGTGHDRKRLRQALNLFRDAGFTFKDSVMHQPNGQPFKIEILAVSPAFERVATPYINNLKRLGIEVSFRLVDPAQYQLRVKEFDFDIVAGRFAIAPTLGETIRQLWGSHAAKTPGSHNLAGIADPAVDALIEQAIKAKSRTEMEIAARALDRVLRAGHYWISQWYSPVRRLALWDIFEWPEITPGFHLPIETTWWIDQNKKKQLNFAD